MQTTDKNFYGDVKTIAIVGAKEKYGSDVDRVGRYLLHAGFSVIPVHPVRQNIWGLKTYTTLAEIQEPVDLVNLFRASEHCLAHAHETLTLVPRPKIFWMQLGIHNIEAQQLLEAQRITVVADKCIMVEHAAAFGLAIPSHGTTTLNRR